MTPPKQTLYLSWLLANWKSSLKRYFHQDKQTLYLSRLLATPLLIKGLEKSEFALHNL